MSTCAQTGIKKIFPWVQSEHGSTALSPLSLECPQGSDSFRHTWSSLPNTISHEIEGKWTRKENLSLLFFSRLTAQFSFSLEPLCGNLQSWAKLLNPHVCLSSPRSLSLSLPVYLLYNTSYFWWHSMISKSEMCRVQFYLNHLHDFIKFNLFIEHLIYGQSLL